MFLDYLKYTFEKTASHLISIILLLLILSFQIFAQNRREIIWNLDNLEKIGGMPISLFGNPSLVKDKDGYSIRFNGIGDGIIVNACPIEGDSTFTIEVIFRPDTTKKIENKEQRFLHIQNIVDDSRRLLIELRIADDKNWFLDTYIRSENSNLTLYAEKFVHPLNEWHHAALVYHKGTMKHFVNGKEEMQGAVKFLPIKNGCVSIGMRMNKRSFFKGDIKLIRFTNQALQPEQFLYDLR